MSNLEMRNMQDHYPERGDQVEAWIKDRRDKQGPFRYEDNEAWGALDNLLDEYRLAADTGRSLENMVNGDEEPPEPRAKKKKRLSDE